LVHGILRRADLTLKRKLVGISVAILFVLFAVKALRYGWIMLTDISAALAFVIVSGFLGSLYWGFKPEVDRWVASRKQKPQLDVKIDQRSLGTPQDLTYLLGKDAPSLRAYLYQCLTIKASKVGVKELMAKTWIDGKGPHILDWVPKASEQASKNRKRVRLFPEEEAQLLIWYAAKSPFGPDKGFPFELTLNSDDVFTSESAQLKKTHIDITIRFIAENYTDPKERKFRLNIGSWDDLNLTWID
jgi:hypothetical protein